LSEQERQDKEIEKLKQMASIYLFIYVENCKSLIDTLASHGKYAKAALLDILGKIDNDHELKVYALKKLESLS
jgi:hypothetical protein